VLTPPLPGLRAEVSLHSLAAGASTAGPDDPPMHEPGSRETAVVEQGPVRFVCGGVAHDLKDGDAVTFVGDQLQRVAQRAMQHRGVQAEHVAQRVLPMHAHERRRLRLSAPRERNRPSLRRR